MYHFILLIDRNNFTGCVFGGLLAVMPPPMSGKSGINFSAGGIHGKFQLYHRGFFKDMLNDFFLYNGSK